MQNDSWIESFRAVLTRAARLLGARNVSLWLNEGKVYDTPGWSGRYLTELAASIAGCTALMRFLDLLEAGDPVPIILMDRHESVEFTMLQLVDGRLYEVWPEGKRLPVDGYRH